jgi:hypothetical protein
VPNSTLKEFLSALLENDYDDQPEIYVKIFEQLKLASANMDANEV